MKLKKLFYKGMGYSNDIRAIRKGRIFQRLWNRGLLKLIRGFMK